jgi:Xaa-Pro aminopeptidase
MRYTSLPAKFHETNRQRLAKAIGDEAIAIIDTADVLTRAGDYEYPFRPESNFYYLTGIAEPESVLVLIPGHSNPALREMLFVSGTSEFIATWEGQRLTPEQASKLSGVKTVLELAELDDILDRVLRSHHVVYTNADASLNSVMTSPANRRIQVLKNKLPTLELRSALPQLATQRVIKAAPELDQLRRAIQLTGEGLKAATMTLRPGVQEYELEADLTATFIRAGSTSAFMPIIAAGKSATIIHSMKNEGLVNEGELVLMDVGAEYGFYAADISRTYPSGGEFSARQRAVYEAVHRLQQFAMSLLKPGVLYQDYETSIGVEYLRELVGLGLITAKEATSSKSAELVREHYPHRTSHFLGLDVHDVGDYSVPLAEGMVLTVEPGIYLPDESIGVRIEDVVVITKTGCELLSVGIASSVIEVEAAVGRNR